MKFHTRFNSQKGMVVVKKYRDKYKLTFHRCLRLKGFEECDLRDRIEIDDKLYLYEKENEIINPTCVYVDDLTGIEYYDYEYSEKEHEIIKKENPEKLANSISRSRSTIYELALCNDWDYFCTFTIDKTKYDRYDLKKWHKDFTQKIRDLNKKYKCKIQYLLIPEQHKDGAWHMHGFLSGMPDQELRAFGREEKLPLYILDKVIRGEEIYSWITYQNKFGFCDIEPIKDINKASAYITKYVSKSLAESITELNAHTYYASKGLKRAEEVQRGFLTNDEQYGIKFEFENDYIKIHWMDEEEFDLVKDFIDKE